MHLFRRHFVSLLVSFALSGCAYIRPIEMEVSRLLGGCNVDTIEGVGTMEDPYILCNEQQVLTMSGATNGTFYKLGNDIELSNAFSPVTNFLGSLDGDGHTITGLNINAPNDSFQGFFSALEDGASVTNIVFDGARITANGYAGVLTGVIGNNWMAQVQVSKITVKNSFVSAPYNAGSISGGVAVANLSNIVVVNSSVVGLNSIGLGFGSGDGNITLENAQVQGYVSAASYVGGLFGYVGDATLSKIGVNAMVSVIPSDGESWMYGYVGGLTGYIWNLNLSDSYIVGTLQNVSGTAGDSFGGLVGYANNLIASKTVVALKNFSTPNGSLTNSYGVLGTDSGGNDFSTGVYLYNHAYIFPETNFVDVVQFNEANMKSQGRFLGLDFTTIWMMAAESAFKFPVLKVHGTNPVFEAGAYRAKEIGNLWFEETPKLDGHTVNPTLSSSFNYGTLKFHNDSTLNVYIKDILMVQDDSFQLATDAEAGNCVDKLIAGTPLYPGNECTVGIRFNPNSTILTQVFRDMLQIKVSVNGVEQIVSHGVDGVGTLDEALISDNAINLTDTIQGQSSSYDHYFSNDGTVDATIISYSFTGDAEITPDYSNCPVSTVLTPSSSCYVTFNFSPVAVKAHTGVLTVTYDNGYGTTKTAEFTVSAAGTEHPFNNDTSNPCQLADGSLAKPFCIYDLEEWIRMGSYSSMNFILTSDLDLTGTGCNTIDPIAGFSGTLDAQNHVIANFCRNDPNDRNVALFRSMSGSVSNLVLQDFTIYGGDFVAAYAATVSGGTHSNITITNADISKDREFGGSQNGASGAGVFSAAVYGGTIDGVSVQGTVAGGHNLGGFTGMIYGAGALIKNSSADVDVTYLGTATGFHCGGFVGFGIQGTIEDSTASGDVTVMSWATGGFVGMNAWANYTRSSASGTVTGAVNTGGFLGQDGANTTIVTDCFATGNVNGSSTAGGFAGSFASTASGSYATGNVSGNTYVGGFVGSTGGNISSSFSSGTVTGASYVGGFSGNNGGTITNSMALKTTLSISGSYGGGFTGSNSGTISNSFSAVRSVQVATDYVGGFGGYNTGTINTSYSLADSVTSLNGAAVFVNPFLGQNNGGTINGSYFNDDIGLGDATASGITSANMTNSGNFTTFDFGTPVWKMPSTNPGADYLSPVPAVLCGNGIVCP